MENRLVDDVYRAFSHSSVHDVSRALKELLCIDPRRFANATFFAALSGKLSALRLAKEVTGAF